MESSLSSYNKVVSHPVNELNIGSAGGIHTDVLEIFPHAQTNPDGCRRIQSDQVMKNPYHYDRNILIHCADKHLT